MATGAKGGFGSKLFRDDGTGTFVAVAEVRDINGAALSHVTDEATNMDSPQGYAEKIATGVKEVGDLTTTINQLQDNATQANLYADLDSGTLRNWRIVYPTGTKRLEFAGFVTGIGHSFPMKGAMVQDLTITVTGKLARVAHP